MNIFPVLVPLGQGAAIFFQVLAVSLDVLDHAVFAGYFIVVGEVADYPEELVQKEYKV